VSGNFEGVKMLDKEKNEAGIEITEYEFKQELKLADKLAIERTVLAADLCPYLMAGLMKNTDQVVS